MNPTLLVDLVDTQADAATRLALRVAAGRHRPPRRGPLRSWCEVRAAARAWHAWRAGARRPPARPLAASWHRRRRRTDETPVLSF